MTTDRITAAQPGSPAARLCFLADGTTRIGPRSELTLWANLATVLDSLDLVHDAATNAVTFGHPLDPQAVLACLDEATGRTS